MDDKLGKILIVDDDENINELIDMYLKSSGYETKKCFNGLDACNIVTNDNIGLVLLDIMIPGKDGVEVLKFIRKQSNVPVIMLTAKGEVFDKVLALELGADDYMVKPFEMLELLVRIEKVLERTGRAKKVLTVRNILVDMQSHQVYKDGLPVSLKPMEYDLFVLLLQNKNIALGREELLKRVWGEDYLGESRTVDVHIGQLRKKLNLADHIKTVSKLGYRLEE